MYSYSRYREIAQSNNFNSTTKLWIQNNGTVYKQYIKLNWTSIRNRLNLRKLAAIQDLYNINTIAMPEKIIYKGPFIEGYIMPFCQGRNFAIFLSDTRIAKQIQYHALLELANTINRLPEGIFVGDLHSGNVLAEADGSIHLIDIDGFSLADGFKISSPLKHYQGYSCVNQLTKYFSPSGRMRISHDSDIFCFFIFFLFWLLGGLEIQMYVESEWFRYLDYLEAVGLDEGILKMIRRIFENESNYIDIEALRKMDLQRLEIFCAKEFVDYENRMLGEL